MSRTPEGYPPRSSGGGTSHMILSMLAHYCWMLANPSLVRQTADAGTVRIKSMRS